MVVENISHGNPAEAGLHIHRRQFLGGLFSTGAFVVASRLVPAELFAQSGAAIIGIYALAKELTRSRLASAIAAGIFVFSPFFMIYSGRVMSETL